MLVYKSIIQKKGNEQYLYDKIWLWLLPPA